MSAKIQIRRDTALNWTATNPVLAQGEPGLEIDTNKVKYGNGSTAWNLLDYAAGGSSGSAGDYSTGFSDGVDDKTYHFVREQGKKEFTFETEGFKLIEITLTSDMVADVLNGNLTFTSENTPGIDDVWLTRTRGNQIYMYTKSDFDLNNWNSWFQNFSNPSTGVYVTDSTPVPFVAGDKIVIRYWSEGTTYVGDYYDRNGYYYPTVSETGATNTVTLNTSYSGWLGNGDPGTALFDLLDPTLLAKHNLNFESNDGNASDRRNITNIVNNNNGTCTFTFDGTAIASQAVTLETFSFPAIDAKNNDNSVTIPHDVYPTFALDCIRPVDGDLTGNGGYRSGYYTVNGGEPVNFYWYGWNDSNTGNFNLYVETNNVVYTQNDTIEVNFYKAPTYINIEVYRSVDPANNWNNGYKWFDWKNDIVTEYGAGAGNNIMGGNAQLLMKVFKAPNRGDQNGGTGALVVQFGWTDQGNYTQSPYDPYNRDYVSNWGNDTYNCYPMYDFDENGIVFYNNDTDSGWSQTYKVRIIYRFDLIIGDEDNNGWFC
ncbi:hypothetical protein UFOVP190_210 [uncultured Caudovirales phage]|uniref:Major tropism determinant N-terminal domain-containing protein n=1 Tax=uncultured Caudovirales phage TaxID=2100421 RepID=A0A6J7WH69_9CAUD|nr:hypothetical protein UFOVP190_210 [uncultured Caudovirales phage]